MHQLVLHTGFNWVQLFKAFEDLLSPTVLTKSMLLIFFSNNEGGAFALQTLLTVFAAKMAVLLRTIRLRIEFNFSLTNDVISF